MNTMKKFENVSSMKNRIEDGRLENIISHKNGSVENNENDSSTERNVFESIPPFIRSKIESTVQKAVQQQKIFSLGHSTYRTVKDLLLKRGWIQKTGFEETSKSKSCKRTRDLEELYTQSLLHGARVTILWTRFVSDWNKIDPKTLVNRFPQKKGRDHFCSKIGLNNNLQNAYWFHEDGISAVKFPRTYNLQNSNEVISFIEDYVMTACISLLKIIAGEKVLTESYNLFQKGGKIPLNIIYYAIKKCDDYITFREHGDLDEDSKTNLVNPSVKRSLKMHDNFLANYNKIVEQKESFPAITPQEMKSFYNKCRLVVQSLPKFLPQVDSDGYRNLWIVKDSDLSCGKGVWVEENLRDILGSGKDKERNDTSRYIVQKYIEKPLLIYGTKFDIRQWFLVTRVDPLQIWMYRKCYLRFSSQPFRLDDTHESVHLCNNSVQKKYDVNPDRHPELPENNMWDSTKFQEYLKSIGQGDKWAKAIYPSMKASITAALQVSQEDMVDRQNSFELYGADFILTEDFSPWLIEINSSPAMFASTSVTRKLCSQCFRDVIKVVIDYKTNEQANTGDFELIYKQYSSDKQIKTQWQLSNIYTFVVIDYKKNEQASTGDFELVYKQCYFYKKISPQWHFSKIYTFGTQLKIEKNLSQNEPLPIMNALKMKKWKHLSLDAIGDAVPKNLIHQQQKRTKDNDEKPFVKKFRIENKNKSNSNSNITKEKEKIIELAVRNVIKTYLRSSKKIKYMSLPQISTVDRTYFQVLEKNNTNKQEIGPEFDEFVSSNTNSGIDFIVITAKNDLKTNVLDSHDSKTQQILPQETDNREKLLTPYNGVENEPENVETDYHDSENGYNVFPEGMVFKTEPYYVYNGLFFSDMGEEYLSRLCVENEEIELFDKFFKTIISHDIANNENINLTSKFEIKDDIQIESYDDFINQIENDNGECYNTAELHSDIEEVLECILEDVYRSNNNYLDCLPKGKSEEEFLHRISSGSNEQIVASNEIDEKYFLNIYLASKKGNDDSCDTNNERSLVEIESANNVINYIIFIHDDLLEYGTNNDSSPSPIRGRIHLIQEPEQIIVNGKQAIQTSINEPIIHHLLEEDIYTILNTRYNHDQILEIQKYIHESSLSMLCNNETNVSNIHCRGENAPDELSEENEQSVSSNGFIQQNNQVISYRRISSVIGVLSILVSFLGYLIIFQK